MTATINTINKKRAWGIGFCMSSIILLLIPYTLIYGHGPEIAWSKTYGGISSERGYSVQQTADRGYIVAGYTNSFGGGGSDVYLIKLDANGDTTWTSVFGGIDEECGFSVQQTRDLGYIVAGRTCSFGAGNYDVYLIKTDANGNELWTNTYGGTDNDYAYSIQQTKDRGYIVAGRTYSFGEGDDDVWLIKTDANGDVMWSKTYGGANNDLGRSVYESPDQGFIIAGYTNSFGAGSRDVYLIKTDVSGNVVWTKTYGGQGDDVANFVYKTKDSGYIIVGYTDSYGAGDYDVYLIKTDASGNAEWIKTYGETDDDKGHYAQETTDGQYVIVGYGWSSDNYDVYLLKTDKKGNLLWTKTYGGPGDEKGYALQQTFDKGYIITGLSNSFGDSGYDAYVIKTDPDLGIEEKESSSAPVVVSQAGPNPFNKGTSVKFNLPKSGNVSIVIYDPSGKVIRELANQVETAGTHTVHWDGKDNANITVASGTYFLRFNAFGYNATKKLLVIR